MPAEFKFMKTMHIEDLVRSLHKFSEGSIIVLESQLSSHPSSDRSVVAAYPKREITATDNDILEHLQGKEFSYKMNPWEALKNFYNQSEGWVLGVAGYDLKNFTENLSSEKPGIAEVPDMYFMEPELLIEIRNDTLHVKKGEEIFKRILAEESVSVSGKINFSLKPGISEAAYISNVNRIKEKISEGDFYELNYSYPMKGRFDGAPFDLYCGMKRVNPVPFAAYLFTEQFSVCCSSPERFLKKTGLHILSEPIKGTSRRSDDPEVDELYKQELLNEKNRAENVMIVDLVRHDMSTVSEVGSVRVSKLFDLQTFDTVHQLISSVESLAKENVHVVDIIKNCFPMGSMTGAPKIEVMKFIDEIENYRRGIYSGAIGYITPDGDFDFNVVIRSAIIKDKTLVYPVGGAITSDSDPVGEWEETLIKAKSITNVVKNRSGSAK
jgi:para-aminobenzoate synthetase component 1